jgi:hypothetical protein
MEELTFNDEAGFTEWDENGFDAAASTYVFYNTPVIGPYNVYTIRQQQPTITTSNLKII